MNLEPVDGREVVRCNHCRLVQFKHENEICVKCKKSYAPASEPVQAEQVGNVDLTSSSGESSAAQSAFPRLPQVFRQFRNDLGLSQRDLSRRMGCQRTYVSKIENGKCVPTLDQLGRIATALNVSVADIVHGTHQTERDPFMLEIIECLPRLNQRNREYLVNAVRQLATTERSATA